MDKIPFDAIHANIQRLKKDAENLRDLGAEFAAVKKNAERMLACIHVLELNVSDLYALNIIKAEIPPR